MTYKQRSGGDEYDKGTVLKGHPQFGPLRRAAVRANLYDRYNSASPEQQAAIGDPSQTSTQDMLNVLDTEAYNRYLTRNRE